MVLYNIILKNQPKTFDLIVDDYATPFTIITNRHAAAYNVFVRELACATKISVSSTMTLLATIELSNKLDTQAKSSFELDVGDVTARVKLALDNLVASTLLSSNIDDTMAHKIIEAVSASNLMSDIEVSAKKLSGVLTNDLLLCSEVATRLGYFHRLLDIDGADEQNTLASLDNMSLNDLEFTET